MNKSPSRRPPLHRSHVILPVAGLILLGLLAAVVWGVRGGAPKEPYRTAAIERGAITRSVSASGSLQALVTVDVGSQISGQISRILVDFNDEVRRGQVLAEIDPQTFQSRVAQAQADVAAGEAALRQAEAQLANAKADYDRKKSLVDQGWYAPSVLDQATAAWRNNQAAVTAARARIAQSRAALRSQQVDLGRTTIVSPIDGVVVDRKVEPGQTVAASLQAPVLFTIAQDLSKLEVKISVDEADVGQVREGQAARFTVDAYPDETFEGVVTQVRKQPTTDQNVVAYTVIAQADNPQGKLLPGMTANADIIIERLPNVLKAPAAALRWSPAGQNSSQPARTAGAGLGGAVIGGPGFGGPRATGGAQRGGAGLTARIPEQLDLDDKQRRTWDAIQADLRQKSMAARAAAGGDRSQVREAMRRNMAEAFARLEPSLRPPQKAKLAALRAAMTEGRGGASGMRGGVVYVLKDGEPSPVPVRVGASDGSFTEVVGDLKPGDQVITGGGPKPKAQARAPFGGSSRSGPARLHP